MVNSAITKIMDTALNLLYPGKWSKNKLLKPMKFLPQANKMDKTVAPKMACLREPFTTNNPKIKRKITIAPA